MMLFGNVGGFVRLLLGYALVQIPGFLYTTWEFLKRRFIEITKQRNMVGTANNRVLNKQDHNFGDCLQKNYFAGQKCIYHIV